MKKLFLLYIFAASAMFTGGCSANMSNESKTMAADVAAAVPTDKQELEFTRFSLFYEKPENFEQYSLLETDEIYSGCSIYSNKSFGSIDEYESKTGLNNKIYSYSINLGQDYPEEFVLSCIACGKIPNIIICPPKEGELFDKEMLKKTAESFAAYKTPLFVQFYPVFPEYDRKEYINFFRMAKKTFTAFSPNSAFVWNVPAEYIRECTSLYPGATYADWVGITLYTNPEQYYDAITAVSDFYAEYAENSPVMISEFGVSHYSPKDNVYETKEAAEFIS
ncbi:MAG: hypothetical protein LBM16_02155, partial [Clostridiales bacterium]|nr:hypothetical protein [Clostridiales bacterium]